MKAILEFELETERQQYMLHLMGPAAHFVLDDLYRELRNRAKHLDDEYADAILSLLLESADCRGVNIWGEY